MFLKTHKKVIHRQNAFWPFLAVDNFLYCIFKNTDQDSICVSIVLKDESEQKHEEHIF